MEWKKPSLSHSSRMAPWRMRSTIVRVVPRLSLSSLWNIWSPFICMVTQETITFSARNKTIFGGNAHAYPACILLVKVGRKPRSQGTPRASSLPISVGRSINSHSSLLLKLQATGIDSSPLCLAAHFLRNRSFSELSSRSHDGLL